MQAIFVHPTDPRADAASLTQALTIAQAGDIVLVGPGLYSPSQTGEVLPLRVPVGVNVEGSGKEVCCIDGEGQFEPSFNPIRTDLSVVVLADRSRLSNVTVTNGGGHGIGVPPGVSATIQNCAISRHGDHGVFLCGVTEAMVTGCDFQDNGRKRFEPTLPRGAGARQGHHIFAEARYGQRNRLLLTANSMRGCFADGIAVVCFFPEPDGVSFDATILRNTIEESERGGLLFSSSFGPSQNHLQLIAADNVLRGNKQFGISILTAIPLAERVPQNNQLHALLIGNDISASPIGILAQGAVGEAHRNTCVLTIDRNCIADCGKNAIRLIGAMGLDAVETFGNFLQTVVSRNVIKGNTSPVVAQGAGGTAKSTPQQNTLSVRFIHNEADVLYERAFLVSDRLSGNHINVLEGSHRFTWTDKDLLK